LVKSKTTKKEEKAIAKPTKSIKKTPVKKSSPIKSIKKSPVKELLGMSTHLPHDMIVKILLDMDSRTLRNTCKTNAHIRELCRSNKSLIYRMKAFKKIEEMESFLGEGAIEEEKFRVYDHNNESNQYSMYEAHSEDLVRAFPKDFSLEPKKGRYTLQQDTYTIGVSIVGLIPKRYKDRITRWKVLMGLDWDDEDDETGEEFEMTDVEFMKGFTYLIMHNKAKKLKEITKRKARKTTKVIGRK